MKEKDENKNDQKRGQQEVQTLTNSYLMIDPNKANGVMPRLYNYTDYNAFSRPTEDIDVSTGSITQSGSAIPSPIVGKYIHLPDGTVSLPALAWASDTASGRYKIGTNNFGESVSGTLVYDWNASRMYFPTIRLRFSTDSQVFTSLATAETEMYSWKQSFNGAMRVAQQNTSTGVDAHCDFTIKGTAGNDYAMGVAGTGATWGSTFPIAAGEAFLFTNNYEGSAGMALNIGVRQSNYIRFCTNASERMRILSGGAVLINATSQGATETLRVNGTTRIEQQCHVVGRIGGGTTSPNYPLDIASGSTGTTIRFGNPTTDTGGYLLSGTAQQAIVSGGAAYNGTNFVAKSTTAVFFGTSWSAGGDFTITSNSALVAGNTFTPTLRLYMDTSGNFGIATTSPRRLIDVLSTANPQLRLTYTDNSVYTDFQTNSSGNTMLTNTGTTINYTVSNTSTNPMWEAIQNSTGDAALRFAIGTTNSWAIGADNSDSDKFKISWAGSGSAALGTNDYFTITVGGVVTFGASMAVSTFLNVGTVTDAAATGDFASGLTGAARIFYDQSVPAEYHYNSSGTIVNQISSVASTATVWNEQGADIDFRIEGDTDVNLIFVDASTDFVGIGTSGPDRKLDILSTSTQLRLTYTDGSVYSEFKTDSGGFTTLSNTGGIFYFENNRAGSFNEFATSNTSSTSGSFAGFSAYVEATTGAADPYLQLTVNSGATWYVHLDNDDGDKFSIGQTFVASTSFLVIESTGSLAAGKASLATTATDGFLYVPACAGTPTGVPTGVTGYAPIVVNTTNNKLYFYSGGAWRDAGP